MNVNKVFLAGRLTRDPELRHTQGGTAVAKFGIATNRTFSVQGEQKESTCFVDITAWGRQAEVIAEHLHKGDPIFVEGRLEYSQWESEQGKRNKLEVTVDSFQFVGGRQQSEEQEQPKARSRSTGRASKDAENLRDRGQMDDSEIPF